MPKMGLKILFIVPYPTGKAPSQRFRFEQYYDILRAEGHEIEIRPFMTEKTWKILYLPGRFLQKALAILGGLFRRLFLLFSLKKYDYIFIHREATPIGPPFFEYIASKWLKKKIIYDFDDAIWIPNYSEANSFFSFLKGYKNVKHICRWAYKISCGNEYLCDFARQYNDNVVYNPTTIDTENYHNKVKSVLPEQFVIGWTGSHSTIRYIEVILPVLKELQQSHPFVFRVISDIAPDYDLESLEYRKWNKETEIEDLLSFSVGIMPLEDDKWANGKCGFKALQYMSLGIPALVSPVGVNTRIVDHGLNGYICSTAEEWKIALSELMEQKERLLEMSARTREKIQTHYSVRSNSRNFLNLFS
jgi:glycosyltransferase involved in cell wall biosynthesis